MPFGRTTLYKTLDRYAVILMLIIFSACLTFLSPVFLTVENLYNILRQIAVIGLLAIGEAFVILLGEIDLSVGSVLALTSVFIAQLLKAGVPIWISILATLCLGTFMGLCTGSMITHWKMPSFIASLAMMSIGKG